MKLLLLLAALAAAVGAAGSPAAPPRPAAGDLSGFSGALPTGTHLVAKPLYHEQAEPTRFRLRAVPCASGAVPGTTCFAARS